MADFSFEDNVYEKMLSLLRISASGRNEQLLRILVPILLCWVPLAIITLIQGTFWTGNMDNSFISGFDTQARLLITLPILIWSD